MKIKIKYTGEALGKIKVIKDDLPSPEQLALKEKNVKILAKLGGTEKKLAMIPRRKSARQKT